MPVTFAPVHRFSAIHKALREEWFACVETADTWIDDGAIGEGESQARRLINKRTKQIGVAKPGAGPKAADGHCRAAHEKLAFDLSQLVGLTVCPVVLWSDGAGVEFKRGRSISSWAFQQSKKWDEAHSAGILSDAHRASAGPMISAMRVFHTWIGDTDRKPSHIHVDLNSPPDELVIAFYDHAFSMSYTWKDSGAPLAMCPNYMAPHGVPEVREAIEAAVDAIEAIDRAEIERLVERVPGVYLPDPQRATIISNLLSRQAQLRALLLKL